MIVGFGLVLPDRRHIRAAMPAAQGLRLDAAAGSGVQAAMRARDVPTAVHYPLPLHHQRAFADLCCPDCCPLSERAGQRVLSLPMSAYLTLPQQDRVVAALREAVHEAEARPT